MKEQDTIEFIRKKDFKFIKKLGNGAFGETILIQDEYINYDFVCKKYKPLKGIPKEEYFKNFINEIKLMHLLHHNNIVRVFNYYLYPEYSTGYIVMEHIEGKEIDKYLEEYPENLNSIFEQTISGFAYLEENNILHRDIRPSNIMIDINNNVKIIDFGFGKQLNFSEDNQKSISLNWWGGEIPNDFKKNRYDFKTEIFFIAKLFQKIIETIDSSFKYESLLLNMSKIDDLERIDSFQTVLKQIKENTNTIDLFNYEEKNIYQNF
ncbi:protein kinase family protein, partial [bacterium]|nr:protein kinase family protein [bacterium]